MEMPTQPKENMNEKPENARFHFAYCANHGYKQFVMYCPKCRRSFCKDCIATTGTGLFCDKCDSALVPTSQLPPLRRRSIATFLALAFGLVGAHNFYIGKTRSAVVQLLLTALVAGFAGSVSVFSSASSVIFGIYWFIIFIVCCLDASGFKNESDVWGRPLI